MTAEEFIEKEINTFKENTGQTLYLSKYTKLFLEQFAFIKCQEMLDNWKKELTYEDSGWRFEDNKLFYSHYSMNGDFEIEYLPQIPPDLLTK